MATFNKPGVYIQEVLTSNPQVANISGTSVGAFIGIADRGPTATVGGTLVGVPTLVSSWDEFVKVFSFDTVTSPFSTEIFGTTANPNFLGTATQDLKYAMYSFFSNGGGNAYVARKVNSGAKAASITVGDNQGVTTLSLGSGVDATVTTTLLSASNTSTVLVATTTGIVTGQAVLGTGINPVATVSAITSTALAAITTNSAASASATLTIATATAAVGQMVTGTTSITVGTYITAIGTGNVTLSATTASAILNASIVFTTNTLSLSASNTAPVTLGSTLTFDGAYLNYTVATNQITITGTTFSSTLLNNVVSFSGVNTTDATTNTALSSANSFVVTGVGSTLTLAYGGTAGTANTVQTAGTVTITGTPSASTSAALVISANSPGVWGNNIWVGITPNQTPNYFDLTVYYGVDATVTASSATYTSLKSSNVVETIPQLSLNASDPRYAPNVANSNWITVSVNAGTPTNPTTRVPAFTSTWDTTSVNATGTVSTVNSVTLNTFKWSSSGIVTETTTGLAPAVRLGGYTTTTFTAASSSAAPIATSAAGTLFASTSVRLTSTTGISGPAADNVEFTAQQFDAVPNQLVINYPSAYDQTSIQKLLDYAANRSDSFVVIDPGSVSTTAATITTYFDNMLLTNQRFGAAYFPNLTYVDPAPTAQIGKTITMPPGGAVAGEICSTDSNRGAFKSPAGVNSVIPGALPVSSLSNGDFDKINSALKNINVIRNVAGYGTCIMGARTLSSPYSDKYISVRRTLNYLEYALKNATLFAVFEPNDANLWAEITSVVSGLLSDYWSKGGLAGATAYQAFYVKCDSTINTSAAIAAGEVRIEVGVALQRPAEFVVIKIGQVNGGTTITTTL